MYRTRFTVRMNYALDLHLIAECASGLSHFLDDKLIYLLPEFPLASYRILYC